jgi:hypothetical protein
MDVRIFWKDDSDSEDDFATKDGKIDVRSFWGYGEEFAAFNNFSSQAHIIALGVQLGKMNKKQEYLEKKVRTTLGLGMPQPLYPNFLCDVLTSTFEGNAKTAQSRDTGGETSLRGFIIKYLACNSFLRTTCDSFGITFD